MLKNDNYDKEAHWSQSRSRMVKMTITQIFQKKSQINSKTNKTYFLSQTSCQLCILTSFIDKKHGPTTKT